VSWVTWTLFHAQGDRHLAGMLAGPLFSIETYVGAGVAVLAALLPGRTRFLWGYVAAALMGVNEWVLRPVMGAARAHGAAAGLTFGAWHGVSALLYGLACLALLRLVWNENLR
jgi:cyanate permease